MFVLLRYAFKYQSRKEIDHQQLSQITANLIQTEETFHRVSRELKRARSKSRSRSRSIRAKRQVEKLASPRIPSPILLLSLSDSSLFHLVIQDSQPIIHPDENKENTPQVNPLLCRFS